MGTFLQPARAGGGGGGGWRRLVLSAELTPPQPQPQCEMWVYKDQSGPTTPLKANQTHPNTHPHARARSSPLTSPRSDDPMPNIFFFPPPTPLSSKWRWVPGRPPNNFHLIIFGGKDGTQTHIYLQFTACDRNSHGGDVPECARASRLWGVGGLWRGGWGVGG